MNTTKKPCENGRLFYFRRKIAYINCFSPSFIQRHLRVCKRNFMQLARTKIVNFFSPTIDVSDKNLKFFTKKSRSAESTNSIIAVATMRHNIKSIKSISLHAAKIPKRDYFPTFTVTVITPFSIWSTLYFLSDTCELRSWGLEALVQALRQNSTKALIAQLDYSTCDVAAKLAHLWNKSLVTWTCPQVCPPASNFTLYRSLIRSNHTWECNGIFSFLKQILKHALFESDVKLLRFLKGLATWKNIQLELLGRSRMSDKNCLENSSRGRYSDKAGLILFQSRARETSREKRLRARKWSANGKNQPNRNNGTRHLRLVVFPLRLVASFVSETRKQIN